MESDKKRGASGSRKRPAKALSDSDEELSSDDDMEFEPKSYSGSRFAYWDQINWSYPTG